MDDGPRIGLLVDRSMDLVRAGREVGVLVQVVDRRPHHVVVEHAALGGAPARDQHLVLADARRQVAALELEQPELDQQA